MYFGEDRQARVIIQSAFLRVRILIPHLSKLRSTTYHSIPTFPGGIRPSSRRSSESKEGVR
jgi:hypothetical protein